MVHNTIGFAEDTNSPFTLQSHGAVFEGQEPKVEQNQLLEKLAISIENIDQHTNLFPLTPKLIGFVNTKFSSMTSWSGDQQVPAKNVHGGFRIRTFYKTIPKNKIQGYAKYQMVGSYTLPMCL